MQDVGVGRHHRAFDGFAVVLIENLYIKPVKLEEDNRLPAQLAFAHVHTVQVKQVEALFFREFVELGKADGFLGHGFGGDAANTGRPTAGRFAKRFRKAKYPLQTVYLNRGVRSFSAIGKLRTVARLHKLDAGGYHRLAFGGTGRHFKAVVVIAAPGRLRQVHPGKRQGAVAVELCNVLQLVHHQRRVGKKGTS